LRSHLKDANDDVFLWKGRSDIKDMELVVITTSIKAMEPVIIITTSTKDIIKCHSSWISGACKNKRRDAEECRPQDNRRAYRK